MLLRRLQLLRVLACSLLLALAGTVAWGGAPLSLHPGTAQDLMPLGRLYAALPGEDFPGERSALADWARSRRDAAFDIFGGAHWLQASVRHDAGQTAWVLDANNTIIEHIDARLYGSDGSVQRLAGGYRAPHAYALHYGMNVTLQPGVAYDVVVRFESPYYARLPRFELLPADAYAARANRENAIALAALGAMTVLGVFYAFLFALARQRSHLWFAGQMMVGCAGWAFTFHVPADLFGWHELRWHYLPFFLAPVFGSMFCIDFLDLVRRHPRSAFALRALAGLSLALSPMAVLALPYAHATATVLISLWITLALASALRSWREGFRPARFFVLAFVALVVPASIILPANLNLVPHVLHNPELWTLVGTMLEGLLQAFALADRIRIVTAEKDGYLAQLGHALKVAHTDVLTGIGNRFAFEKALQDTPAPRPGVAAASQQLLLIIDLDGLKPINDRDGHHRGDALIKALADGLVALTAPSGACFRIGGDEFAVIAPAADEARVHAGLALLEAKLHSMGFADSGISYGLVHWRDQADPRLLVQLADKQMYAHKTQRKQARVPVAHGGG